MAMFSVDRLPDLAGVGSLRPQPLHRRPDGVHVRPEDAVEHLVVLPTPDVIDLRHHLHCLLQGVLVKHSVPDARPLGVVHQHPLERGAELIREVLQLQARVLDGAVE
eukprot:5231116-Pyramimonas_sp.AAC.1